MEKTKAVVIGAGLTGLSTAWRLGSAGIPVTIIEKENGGGGLSRTIDWDGWKFDYGPHNFHTNDEQIIDFYMKRLPKDFMERKLNVKLYIFKNLVSYPLMGADVLLSLSGLQMARATIDFILSRARAFLYGIPETNHLDEWIIRRFGKVLYGAYFGPYISRVWKADPHRLSKTIGELKIPILSIRNYIKRELFKGNSYNPEDISQWRSFYVKHGIGKLSQKFMDDLKNMEHVRIKLGEEVKAMHASNGKITAIETTKGKIQTGSAYVISTIPLNVLIQYIPEVPYEIRLQSDNLEYCSERFLFLKVKKPSVSGFDWTYFSEDRYPFNRVSEFSHDRFEMVPPGHSALTFEFPCNKDDWEWNVSDDKLLDCILPLYNEVFNLNKNDITDYRSEFQKYAYPRFTAGYEKVIEEIFSYLTNIDNLYSIGRLGMFCYLNMDGATKIGLDTAEAIIKNKEPNKHHVELLKKYHRIV